jgi:hypothetical protein
MNTRPVSSERDGLAAFLDQQRQAVRIGAVDDLGGAVPLPAAPWLPDGCTVRWVMPRSTVLRRKVSRTRIEAL